MDTIRNITKDQEAVPSFATAQFASPLSWDRGMDELLNEWTEGITHVNDEVE